MATIAYNKLPIVIFVFNNKGCVSIRQTQSNFFGALYGCDDDNGIGFPDILAVASSFGVQTAQINGNKGMQEKIIEILTMSGPVLCELVLDPSHTIEPKLSSEKLPDGKIVSKPLEDMYPFLDREEFKNNMLISDQEPD